jgi:hypothetical protein
MQRLLSTDATRHDNSNATKRLFVLVDGPYTERLLCGVLLS